MRSVCLLVALLAVVADAAVAAPVRLTPPRTRYTHPREDNWKTPSYRDCSGSSWEPGSAKSPPTREAGWQNVPSNTWKAPRDAREEQSRERRRHRQQGGGLRIDTRLR